MKVLRVLLADDDRLDREAVLAALVKLGESSSPPIKIEPVEAVSEADALNQYRPGQFDLVVLDLRFDDNDEMGEGGLRVLRAIRKKSPGQPVILVSQVDRRGVAKEGAKLKAAFVVKRTHDANNYPSYLRQYVRPVFDSLAAQLPPPAVPEPADVLKSVAVYAKRDFPLLIRGAPGVGKTRLAKRVHELSNRSKGPFIEVDLSAVPRDLIDAKLFGSEPGSYTNAPNKTVKGCAEQAHGGTLFIDEIGNLEFALQARLLRVLREKKIQRVGGSEDIVVDIRVIAATNKLLGPKRFMPDLYQRIAGQGAEIWVPELRKRKDLEQVVVEMLEHKTQDGGEGTFSIDPGVFPLLRQFSWPGNLADVDGVLNRAIAKAAGAGRTVIEAGDIEFISGPHASHSSPASTFTVHPELPTKFNACLLFLELREQHQRVAAGKLTNDQIAPRLGMSKATYYRTLKLALCAQLLLGRGVTDKEAASQLDFEELAQELSQANPNQGFTAKACRKICSSHLWTGGIGG